MMNYELGIAALPSNSLKGEPLNSNNICAKITPPGVGVVEPIGNGEL